MSESLKTCRSCKHWRHDSAPRDEQRPCESVNVADGFASDSWSHEYSEGKRFAGPDFGCVHHELATDARWRPMGDAPRNQWVFLRTQGGLVYRLKTYDGSSWTDEARTMYPHFFTGWMPGETGETP